RRSARGSQCSLPLAVCLLSWPVPPGATLFPYTTLFRSEEHKFFCDYWFLTRWWNKIREFGALLARRGFLADGEDVFHLSRILFQDRKSTRLNSSHLVISYAVFCLKKKNYCPHVTSCCLN